MPRPAPKAAAQHSDSRPSGPPFIPEFRRGRAGQPRTVVIVSSPEESRSSPTPGIENADLVLAVIGPPEIKSYGWQPFTGDSGSFTLGWWDDAWRFQYASKRRWFGATLAGEEVCRVEIELGSADDYSVGSAILGTDPIVGIEFIDVAETHRRRGIATAVIRHVELEFPDHRLVAFSEEADSFWSSLGWDRHGHPEGDDLHRPLFVQPRLD